MRDHDGGVNIEHDHFTEVGAGSPAGRNTAGQLCPHVAPDPGSPAATFFNRPAVTSSRGAPHRRRRRDRTKDPALVAQHVNVGDRLTPSSEHHRHIDQHPPTIMHRREVCDEPSPGTVPRSDRSGQPAAGSRRYPRGPPHRHHQQSPTDPPTTMYASPAECLPLGILRPSASPSFPCRTGTSVRSDPRRAAHP